MEAIPTFYRMTPFETAVGWIFGFESAGRPTGSSDVDPRWALEKVILEALLSEGPTFVSFSGGRDSSAVLALAVDLARREGLQLPVPVTNRYPGVGSTEEDQWQELVIKHLGVGDWVRLVYGERDDLLGESARHSLLRFGLLWPPTLHLKGQLLDLARGGTVLTGEGGDSLFGVRRLSPVTGLLARRVYPRRRAIKRALESAAPRQVRRGFLERDLRANYDRPWLTLRTRTALAENLISDALAEPLIWSRGVRKFPRTRAVAIGLMNQKTLAGFHGVRLVHPFHEPSFVRSWAKQGGILGYPGRAAAMEALFGDVLPPQVLKRTTKATFGAAYVGAPSREFVRTWAGNGVDRDLVIPERLKEELLGVEPHAGTFSLLHAIWYETRDNDVSGFR